VPEILVDVSRCLACRSCELACAIFRDSVGKSLMKALNEDPRPSGRVTVQGTESLAMPIQCRHCTQAICLESCPSGALERHESGAVLLREEKCIGCFICAVVCPFGAISAAKAARTVVKCDRCVDMDYPYCVDSCPTDALILGDVARLRVITEERSGRVVRTFFRDGGKHASTYTNLDYGSDREVDDR